MFNATYFTYNNILSARHRLKIASFDGNNGKQETQIISQAITTTKAKNSNRFSISNVDYAEAPEFEMSILSEIIITSSQKRKILAWLCGDNDFHKLIMHDPDVEKYYYMCKFKNVTDITINGHCFGFKVTAVFDAPYQYGEPTILSLSAGEYNEYEITIKNNSDFYNKYTYPLIEFKLTSGSEVKITNVTDDETRTFIVSNIPEGKLITIDNELKILNGEGITLSDFNKKWLRLLNGDNKLKITMNGELKINCPQYTQIYF